MRHHDTFRALVGYEARVNGRQVPITISTDGREVIVYQAGPPHIGRELNPLEFPEVYTAARKLAGVPEPEPTERKHASRVSLIGRWM